jgi:hypothetical protein
MTSSGGNEVVRLASTRRELGLKSSLREFLLDRRAVAAYATIVVLFGINNYRVLIGPTRGDDEPTQFIDCQLILHRLARLDFVGVAKVFSTVISPPLRYVLELPGQALFPHTLWGPRLGSVVVSFIATVAIVRLGREIAGPTVGYASGVLVAASSVYTSMSLAFGWSAFVLGLVQALRLLRGGSLDLSLREERRRFYAINGWLGLAFLLSPATASFIAMTYLFYAIHNARQRLAIMLRAFAPPATAFALVIGYFWVVVPLLGSHFGKTGSFGLAGYTFGRQNNAGLSFETFASDLRALNAHLLPFVSWALLALGIAYVSRRERRTLAWLLPHLLLWGFYFQIGSTEPYFMVGTVLLLPFAVAQVAELVAPRAGVAIVAVTAALFLGWSVAFFVRAYPEDEYPSSALAAAYAHPIHSPNLVQPYRQILADITQRLSPGKLYVDDVDDSFPEFYANPNLTLDGDPRRAGRLGTDVAPLRYSSASDCYTVRPSRSAIALVITKRLLCAGQARETVVYPHSRIHLYVLNRT